MSDIEDQNINLAEMETSHQNKQQQANKKIIWGGVALAGTAVLLSSTVLSSPLFLLPAAYVLTSGLTAKIFQDDLKKMTTEKVNVLLHHLDQKAKDDLFHQEDVFSKNLDDAQISFLQNNVAIISASVLSSTALPPVFPLALFAYGIYKSYSIAKAYINFSKEAKNINEKYQNIVNEKIPSQDMPLSATSIAQHRKTKLDVDNSTPQSSVVNPSVNKLN